MENEKKIETPGNVLTVQADGVSVAAEPMQNEHDPDCGLEPAHVGDCATKDFQHTKGARERALRRMLFAIEHFYAFAQVIGNHQFLEFAGLMHAYVTSCQAMHERGVDFMTNHLELEDHRAGYLGEKLFCIYGVALKKPENLAAFCRGLGIQHEQQQAPV